MKLLNSIGAMGVVLLATGMAWAAKRCDPFIPQQECEANVDFSSGQHDTIAVLPKGQATINLDHKPSFSTCQAGYAPSPPARTADASVGALLTALGGLGLVGGGPGPVTALLAPAVGGEARRAGPSPPNAEATKIVFELVAIAKEERRLLDVLNKELPIYQRGISGSDPDPETHKNITPGVNDIWGKTDEPNPKDVQRVKDTLTSLVQRPEPNIESLQAQMDALNRAVADYHRTYDGTPDAGWLDTTDATVSGSDAIKSIAGDTTGLTVNGAINIVSGIASRYQDFVNDVLAIRTTLKQDLNELSNAKAPYTKATLPPVPKFVNNDVTISITCKDDVSQAQSSTTVTFTGYYTRLPWLDFSAGPLFSLLGRHQVGILGQTAAQAASGVNANGTFGLTDRSAFQVIPMAFVEIHPSGFKCWWASPKDAERRAGYVCTFGIAVGAGPNNSTGTTQAEFFEGVSFAVQRVSFIFGFHDGRVEQLGGGYGLFQPVPSAGYTPIINRYFNVRPAFSITYRIPLR